MFRPCINKKTLEIETIEIESCLNIEDYIIVGMSREYNEQSLNLNGNIVNNDAPTRKIALEQEAQYEEKLINEAVTESKRRKVNNNVTETSVTK